MPANYVNNNPLFPTEQQINDLTPNKLFVSGAYAAVHPRSVDRLFQAAPKGNGRYKYELTDVINNWLVKAIIGGHVYQLNSLGDLSNIQNPKHGDVAIINDPSGDYIALYNGTWLGPYQFGGSAEQFYEFTSFRGGYVGSSTVSESYVPGGLTISVTPGQTLRHITVAGTPGDLDANNNFKIDLQYHGFFNDITLFPPAIQVWDTSLVGTQSGAVLINNPAISFTYTPGAPPTPGIMRLKIENLNVLSNWMITLSF